MKLEEYTEKKKSLSEKHSKEFKELHIQYAKANNPYKSGDILQDHYQIIKVEEIRFTMNKGICSCIYKGARLKKNLKPFANGEKIEMYQTNIENTLH